MNYYGNKKLLNNYKIGFLCSRKVPADKILKCYDWATQQRDMGNCIISGFHSKIEKDVFHYLSKGTQPVIIVLARAMYKRIPKQFTPLLNDNRLLLISALPGITRVSRDTSLIRNQLILELSNELVIGYKTPGGMIDQLIVEQKNNKNIQYL